MAAAAAATHDHTCFSKTAQPSVDTGQATGSAPAPGNATTMGSGHGGREQSGEA